MKRLEVYTTRICAAPTADNKPLAPAMLNYTAGASGLLSAVGAAQIRVVYTSSRFISAAILAAVVSELSGVVRIVYLEDIRATLTEADKVRGWLRGRWAERSHRRAAGVVHPD